jgi:hypothetical protein
MARFPITMQRNGDYQENWRLRDAAGVGIVLTGHVLRIQIKETPDINATALLELTEGVDLAVSGIVITDADEGRFTVTIKGADFDTIGVDTNEMSWAWDFVTAAANGIKTVHGAGEFILQPGVTTE